MTSVSSLETAPEKNTSSSNFGESYLSSFETSGRSQNPTERLMNTVSPEMAFDFVTGCVAAEAIIFKEKADIVVVPERGAGPIAWTIQNLQLANGHETPRYIYPNLGTHTIIRNGRRIEAGLTGTEKIELINHEFDELQELGQYDPVMTKVLLLDEVQKGTTISQASKAIANRLQKDGNLNSLSVIAMDDVRIKEGRGTNKNGGYKRMIANESTGIRTSVIPVNLFTVDRHYFLNSILHPDVDEKNFKLLRTLQNTAAQEVFRSLTLCFTDPISCMKTLTDIEAGIVPEDGDVFGQWAMEALTYPRNDNFDKRAANHFGWLRSFLNQCLDVYSSKEAEKDA